MILYPYLLFFVSELQVLNSSQLFCLNCGDCYAELDTIHIFPYSVHSSNSIYLLSTGGIFI